MRRIVFPVAVGWSCLFGGCAVFHHLDDYTTDGKRPGVASDSDAGTSASSLPVTDGSVPACQTNRECTDKAMLSGASVVAPSVCVRATGSCAALLSAQCPRLYGDYTNDDAIVLGTLVAPKAGSDQDDPLELAAFLAAAEINAAVGTGKGTRPLVLVGCDSGDVVEATRHLVTDLHVPAIVGPTTGEDVVTVTQQVSAKGGTLIMTPTSLASAISNLADEGLTWRAVPSDTQRAKLVIEQMNALETLLRTTRGLTTVKLGIVHPTDALGLSAHDAVSGKLILNGRFINDPLNAANVSVDSYQPVDAAAESAIATKYAVTFKPDIVFITAEDQIANLMLPLEKALTAARAVNRPYYVLTDAAKADALLAAIGASTLPSDIRRRIRGVGVRPDASSAAVLAEFVATYTSRYGAAPPGSFAASAAVSYDAMYAFAYALAATPELPPSGASVAQGLRALGVGDSYAVGAKTASQVMSILAARKSVSLRGTFGPLLWDSSGDITAGSVEVWCIGGPAGAPAFGSSGLTMDVSTQVVGGAFVQCQ